MAIPRLPASHPQRFTLANEVHARPPARLDKPERIAYLALYTSEAEREQEVAALQRLVERVGVPLPALDSGHLFIETPGFRLKWERHTEFSSYTFFRRVRPEDPPDQNALADVPADWLAGLPGKLMVAATLEVRPPAWGEPEQLIAKRRAADETIIGSAISDGAGWAFTDLRIDKDGFLSFILLDEKLSERQSGRTAQRLLEIETYRMMALLAFPLARQVGQFLNRAESELATLTGRMTARVPEEEAKLLEDLSRIAAEVEQSVATSAYRFAAAQAYYDLVKRRIAELREVRLAGIQTIEEFMERRLAPALNTCAAIARRQEELSARIARSSQLLRTRVDIQLEQQNQELLAQMNRRAILQLRLQRTVEGLSVIAMTYYGAGLVHYVAKALAAAGANVYPELAAGLAVPVVAAISLFGLNRVRKHFDLE